MDEAPPSGTARDFGNMLLPYYGAKMKHKGTKHGAQTSPWPKMSKLHYKKTQYPKAGG